MKKVKSPYGRKDVLDSVKVRHMRGQKKMSQRQIGAVFGVTRQAVSQFMKRHGIN